MTQEGVSIERMLGRPDDDGKGEDFLTLGSTSNLTAVCV